MVYYKNVTPSDKFFGKDKDVLKMRVKIMKQTMKKRRRLNQMGLVRVH